MPVLGHHKSDVPAHGLKLVYRGPLCFTPSFSVDNASPYRAADLRGLAGRRPKMWNSVMIRGRLIPRLRPTVKRMAGRPVIYGAIRSKGWARVFSSETFLNGEASPYIEQMYENWKQDPKSVHASWNAYFKNVEAGVPVGRSFTLPPSSSSTTTSTATAAPPASAAASATAPQIAHDTSRIIRLVQGYQSRGHEFAKIDPLELPHTFPFVSAPRCDARLTPIDYKTYGFTEADLDRTFQPHLPGVTGFLSIDRPPVTLRQLVQRLEETYCGTIGIEAAHIEDPNVTNYLRQALETPTKFEFDPDMKKRILTRTIRAQLFESFCGTKFNTSKRFGVDGCESAIVAVKGICKKAAALGVSSVVIGMPHRGRLNMLINVMHKPMQQMMCEFQGITGFGGSEWGNTGDVKYHLGVDFDHFDEDIKRWIHLSVLANPSHLEAVDPLVVGQVRAQQYYSNDTDRERVLPVLMHGDASFAGQVRMGGGRWMHGACFF